VVLVVQENHEFGQIIGSRQAPFLNRLAATGTLLTRYFAIGHPPLPNYVALVAGDPLGIRSDCRSCRRPGRTLVDQLEAAGISWKAYYQGLPAPCSPAARAGAYTMKVNPFLHSTASAPPRRAADRSSPSACSAPTYGATGFPASPWSPPTSPTTCTAAPSAGPTPSCTAWSTSSTPPRPAAAASC